MKQQDKTKLGRRDFLRALGAGAGAAATAAAPLASEASRIRKQRGKDARRATRRTPTDVKAFYRVNRYPS